MCLGFKFEGIHVPIVFFLLEGVHTLKNNFVLQSPLRPPEAFWIRSSLLLPAASLLKRAVSFTLRRCSERMGRE